MAHPFFEASAYPWWLPEATEFHAALGNLIQLQGRIDALYKACGENLPALNLGQAPDLVWRDALNSLGPCKNSSP